MSLSKKTLKESILIVIQPDGTIDVKVPDDEDLEFSRKAYNDMMNTMLVIDKPSFVLLTALYIERFIRSINSFFSNLARG